MIQLVLGGHRLGLIVCNPCEGCIQGDALLSVLQAKVRNHLRRIGRGRPAQDCGGKTKRQPQQQSLPRQNDYPRYRSQFFPASSN